MSKIFLATHGHMASGMASSLEILYGNLENLTVFDAYVDGEEKSVEDAVDDFFTKCDDNETKLLISDMFGGSVNNTLTLYSNKENTFVLTGITLSLLLELICHCDENFTENQLNELIENSRLLTKLIKVDNTVVVEEDFF